MKKWQLAIGLGVIFLIGAATVLAIRLNLPDSGSPATNLDVEIAKAALSGCIVAVIGAVLAALVKAREQSVQAAKLRAEILNQMIHQLGEIYRSVKASRRHLRSLGLTSYYDNPPNVLSKDQVESYKQEMNSIEKAQLSLEDLKIQVVNLPPFTNMESIAQRLKEMEDYLRVLLKESEEELPNANVGSLKFTDLVRLNEFTESTKKGSLVPKGAPEADYRFKTHFANAYDDILKEISRNLKDLAGA